MVKVSPLGTGSVTLRPDARAWRRAMAGGMGRSAIGARTGESSALAGRFVPGRRSGRPVRNLPPVAYDPIARNRPPASTGLLTDHYELTMLAGALRSGAAGRRAVFEVFARHLPHGRRYGVVAGTGRLLDALERFRFGPDELDFLRQTGVADETTLGYLASFAFTGDIWGYAEGDCYFPGSPILVVEAPFAEAVVLVWKLRFDR